jgi:DNA-binding MarR family transcriptional regulator
MKRRASSRSISKARDSLPEPVHTEQSSETSWESMPGYLSERTGCILRRAGELGDQLYAAAVATLNLTPPQLSVLELLRREGAMVQSRLSDRLHIDKATMVGLLNALEAKHLVERRPHPSDRRAFQVHLRPDGEKYVIEADHIAERAKEHFFAPLSSDEEQTLRELLIRLVNFHTPRLPPEE